MAGAGPRAPRQGVEPEGEVTNDEASSRTRLTIDLAALMRSRHEGRDRAAHDESTETHYVNRFVFKVNNTLSVTRVFTNKDLEKSQDMQAHTLKAEISEIKTTGAERIREITRLAKELEKKQGEMSQEEEIILLQPRRPQEEPTTTPEPEDPRPAADESPKADTAEGAGPSQLTNEEDSQPSDAEGMEMTSADGPEGE